MTSCWDELPDGLAAAIRALIVVFAQADTLGSLIDPQRICREHGTTWDVVAPYWWGLFATAATSGQPVTHPRPTRRRGAPLA